MDELGRMEATKTIGSIIEWIGFKNQVLKLRKEALSLRTKSGHQAKKIKMLESQLRSYKALAKSN